MGTLSTYGQNQALDHIGDTVVGFASAHTADPGDTGTSEVSGGSYARKAISFAAASGGSKAISGTVVFDIPAGTTVTHVGLWTAVSGGSFVGDDDLASPEAFGADGTLTVDTFNLT